MSHIPTHQRLINFQAPTLEESLKMNQAFIQRGPVPISQIDPFNKVAPGFALEDALRQQRELAQQAANPKITYVNPETGEKFTNFEDFKRSLERTKQFKFIQAQTGALRNKQAFMMPEIFGLEGTLPTSQVRLRDPEGLLGGDQFMPNVSIIGG